MRGVWMLVFAAAACRGILGIDDPIVTSDGPPALTDGALPPPGCPGAPGGCKAFGCAGTTTCYYACSTPSSWQSAALFCGMHSLGCLAVITTVAESRCIAANTLPNGDDAVWIGYAQDPIAAEPRDGWQFTCAGQQSTLVNWALTDPNNLTGDEDCAALRDSGAGWFDQQCTSTFRFACTLAP